MVVAFATALVAEWSPDESPDDTALSSILCANQRTTIIVNSWPHICVTNCSQTGCRCYSPQYSGELVWFWVGVKCA